MVVVVVVQSTRPPTGCPCFGHWGPRTCLPPCCAALQSRTTTDVAPVLVAVVLMFDFSAQFNSVCCENVKATQLVLRRHSPQHAASEGACTAGARSNPTIVRFAFCATALHAAVVAAPRRWLESESVLVAAAQYTPPPPLRLVGSSRLARLAAHTSTRCTEKRCHRFGKCAMVA